MKYFWLVLLVVFGSSKLNSQDHEMLHQQWDQLLKTYVCNEGHVDYEALLRNKKKLDRYILSLTKNTPGKDWSRSQKLAYWINAYNALTIDLILQNYPLESIKDIKNPWDQSLWQLGSKSYSLNDIEHNILRKMNEPRIHFAIVCASESCPKLLNKAYFANNLEAQLTKATEEFLSDSAKNKISKDEVQLSKIFKWFKKDFEQNGSLIDFLNRYSGIEISKSAKKNYLDYSWKLNN